MKNILFILPLMLISFYSHSQAPEDLIKKFFSEYTGNTSTAIDNLYATNAWAARMKDGIENIKKEINSYTIDYMGKYYGYEPIIKKQFSESFILFSYMVKYDRQPLRFTFQFYKPNDKWTIFSFKIDGNIDDEIEEAAKLYYLNLNN